MLLFVYTIGIGFLDWNAVGVGRNLYDWATSVFGQHRILGTWDVAEKKAVDLG
jgi:hypothetical protein